MKFYLDVFRDDRAASVRDKEVGENYVEEADILAASNHLGDYLLTTEAGTRYYANGTIYVSPITDQGE